MAQEELTEKILESITQYNLGTLTTGQVVNELAGLSKLYARSKWEQACEEQKKICANSAFAVVHEQSILQAQSPEFKP